MLVTFPELLFLAPLSAMLLRASLALLLACTAWVHASQPGMLARAWAAVEIIAAVALAAGAYTQPTALAAAVWLFAGLFVSEMRVFPKSTLVLAIVVALSLVGTGAGAFAFDLPL